MAARAKDSSVCLYMNNKTRRVSNAKNRRPSHPSSHQSYSSASGHRHDNERAERSSSPRVTLQKVKDTPRQIRRSIRRKKTTPKDVSGFKWKSCLSSAADSVFRNIQAVAHLVLTETKELHNPGHVRRLKLSATTALTCLSRQGGGLFFPESAHDAALAKCLQKPVPSPILSTPAAPPLLIF